MLPKVGQHTIRNASRIVTTHQDLPAASARQRSASSAAI
jgi:hypothetical protein